MCSTPSEPATPVAKQTQTQTAKKEEVAQTQANAAVTKADPVKQNSTLGERNKQTGLAGRDIKTAPRGLRDVASVSKKTLLGE